MSSSSISSVSDKSSEKRSKRSNRDRSDEKNYYASVKSKDRELNKLVSELKRYKKRAHKKQRSRKYKKKSREEFSDESRKSDKSNRSDKSDKRKKSDKCKRSDKCKKSRSEKSCECRKSKVRVLRHLVALVCKNLKNIQKLKTKKILDSTCDSEILAQIIEKITLNFICRLRLCIPKAFKCAVFTCVDPRSGVNASVANLEVVGDPYTPNPNLGCQTLVYLIIGCEVFVIGYNDIFGAVGGIDINAMYCNHLILKRFLSKRYKRAARKCE